MKKHEETGHKQDPSGTDAGVTPNADGSMAMGMTGIDGGADPDQKSTHNAPKTIESTLPDGSPKFADAPKGGKKASAKAGKFEVVSRISTKVDGRSKTFEIGEIVELEAGEAESLGENVKPAR